MNGGASIHPKYELTSPIFDKITIHLNKDYYFGGKFVIETRNNSDEDRYIQSAMLNGESVQSFSIEHKAVVSGGELILEMGNAPNREWGIR